MGIERLQLFCRISNVCGLFPFRMIVEEGTGEFKCFNSSWRHPAIWWFLFLLIGHIYFSVIWIYYSWLHLTIDESQSLTKVRLVVLMLFFAIVLILLSIPLLFIFLYRHLETAIDILNRFDRKLCNTHCGFCSDRRRMYIGIAVTVISVFLVL